MNKVILKKNEDHRITNGHLWAFSNEIAAMEGEPLPGDIVKLFNHQKKFLGAGIFNPNSLIAVRLLSREDETIDFQFFKKRIEAALDLRKKIYANTETYRLVHGEGDLLPGLIVDKFDDYLAVQTFSVGMDRRLTLICDVLESLLHPKGIIERNEALVRTMEGLEQRKGILRGSVTPVTISEYGVQYTIDLLEGQKTGFFLDQRENRRAFRRYVNGANVLDCFCNEGGFALNAAYAEAASVVGVDISEPVIRRAIKNTELNKLAHSAKFFTGDAFEYLEHAVSNGKKFDVINLDPPSFAKSKKTVSKAIRGYKEIHTNACKLLNTGGFLATESCSHNVTEESFLSVIDDGARSAGRTLKLLEWHGAAPDHPVLPSMPETRYLKFGIFQID